ncbi:MAG TPA: hypothetical protein VHJ76_06005 [Actinomycetota bacterium]|nr:hypothetical protein [Actinomycetota bacterium]
MPRRNAAAAVAVALLTALLPASSVAGREAVHELRGRITFVADETGKARFAFPRAVALEDLRFGVRGDGRVYGFMMRKLGHYEQEGLRPVMSGVTIGTCMRRGCKHRGHRFVFIPAFNVGRKVSGTWEIAVVADGAPVEVTIGVKGERGGDVVRADGPVASEIRTLAPRVHERETDTLYSAGDFTRLRRAGYGLVGLWAIGAPHGASAFGSCTYHGGESVIPTPSEESAFAPGCPTSDSFEHVSPMPGERGGFVYTVGTYGNIRGLGGWYTTASAVERFGAVALWIDF